MKTYLKSTVKNGSLTIAMALLLALFLGAASPAGAFTSSDATTIWNNFNDAFYVGNNGNAYYLNIHGGTKLSLWQQAETIEMACDREEVSGSSSDQAIITALCNGFEADYGTDWTGATEFNDDVMWACLAFARAYYRTGNSSFAGLAADNFNYVYNGGGHRTSPQYDNTLGGGLWWTTNHGSGGSKNACCNGPGALAGYWLYDIYGSSTGFLNQAQNMYNWEKGHLFNASNGQVYDHEDENGTIVENTPLTYNQGTFLGAAHFLGDDTSASAAALYTMNDMCTSGILPQYTPSTDSAGFNGIFIRWLGRYMNDTGTQGTYDTWLYNNANTAWNIQNANGLSWCDWLSQTPASGNYSWSCSDTVVTCRFCLRNNCMNSSRPGRAASIIFGPLAAGAILTSLGSNCPSAVTRSFCAAITSRMFLQPTQPALSSPDRRKEWQLNQFQKKWQVIRLHLPFCGFCWSVFSIISRPILR